MSKMSYCRFENTSGDVRACVREIDEALESGVDYDKFKARLSEQLGDTSRVAAALGAIRETERKEQLRRQQEVADLLVDYGCHYLDGVCKCEAYYDCKYYRKDFPGGNRG